MYVIKPSILFLLLCFGYHYVNGQSKVDTIPVKYDSLKAAIVTAREIRPRLKGDTVEFNTAHLRMRPNAAVEEMLARLPGLQIDANGNITYNGEKISKLLVDGEDFFGSDPTIVTRNFDASRIDKVQILDRKSDQAIFTGIDDGTRTKTLNLVMKQESKNGYFGKVEAGTNTDGIYSANGLLADLQEREQFAALGFASNTGSTGFNSDVGGSSASIMALNKNNDPLGGTAGTGIPRFFGAALHYANSWNGPDDRVLGNYQYSNSFTQPVTTTMSLETLLDSIYGQYQQSHSTNRQNQHWAYGIYDVLPEDLSAIHVEFHASTTAAENQYGDTALSTFNGINVNSSLRTIQDDVSEQNIGGSVSYRLQARRNRRRAFTISAGGITINNSTSGYLYSIDHFYQPNGSSQNTDTTDQRKEIVNQSHGLSGGMTYAQPLGKTTQLGLILGASYNGTNALQGTYNKADGKYALYIDSLSSHYHSTNFNQSASLIVQGGDSRFTYTLGAAILRYNYRQQDLQADSQSVYRYWNATPHLRVSYTPDHMTHFVLEYQGSSQQPTPAQLQPIVNNSNPLLITLGNPGLRPGFNQNWRLNASRVKAWMYNVTLNVGLTGNSISTKTTTDSLGRQISQPVNVNGGKNAGAALSLHKRILGIDLGLNTGINYGRSVNYVNADLNKTDNYTETGGVSIGYYSADKFSAQINTQFSYFDTRSSINPAAPLHYWTQSHSGNLTLFFIPGFELHTDAVYTWQEGTSAFARNTSVLLWNASVLHNFLDNRLGVRFQANNLLNANAGISRSSLSNLNSQTSTNIIGRYWLLSVVYHFDHPWKKKAP